MKKEIDSIMTDLMSLIFLIMVPVARVAMLVWIIALVVMVGKDSSRYYKEHPELNSQNKVVQETAKKTEQKSSTQPPKTTAPKPKEDSMYDSDGILIKKPTKSVELKHLYNINKKQKFFRTNVSDTFGHTYDEACLVDFDQYDFDNRGAVLFDIHGDDEWFSIFRSKVVPGVYKDGYRHAGKDTNKIIFTDENDNVLYESGDISETTEPFLVEFDVTGVKVLKIKADSYGAILLLNPLLIP